MKRDRQSVDPSVIRGEQSLVDARSKLSSQVGSSLFNPSLKGYASSFIHESLFKK